MTVTTWILPVGVSLVDAPTTTVTRFAVYEAWIAATAALRSLARSLREHRAWSIATDDYGAIAARLVDLRERLPLGAAVLLPPLAPVPDELDASHLLRLQHTARTLSALVADRSPMQVRFAPTPVALELERRLVDAVLEAVPRHRQDARCELRCVADAAQVPLPDARRTLCAWLDRWLVLRAAADATADAAEVFLVLDAMYEHAAAWTGPDRAGRLDERAREPDAQRAAG